MCLCVVGGAPPPIPEVRWSSAILFHRALKLNTVLFIHYALLRLHRWSSPFWCLFSELSGFI